MFFTLMFSLARVKKYGMIDKILETGDLMAHTDLIKGICPHCGETLEVPAHLKQFSCMYCGARLSPSELGDENKKPAPVISESEAEEAAAYYEANILSVITKHRGIEKSLNKNSYEPAISQYAQDVGPVFEKLNLAVLSGTLTQEAAAASFIDQLEKQWDIDVKVMKPKKTRGYIMDSDKFIIAIFLVPMIRTLGLSAIDDYCHALHAEWLRRYPKSPWQVGDYDTIAKGFKKKFLGLCFITTAVCLQDGKADDCAELTAFRNFRDGYLRACPDGADLIDSYYATAPSIVLEIEKTEDREARYAAIRETWLEPCFRDIRNGDLRSCKERYTDMVQTLQKEYLS